MTEQGNGEIQLQTVEKSSEEDKEEGNDMEPGDTSPETY